MRKIEIRRGLLAAALLAINASAFGGDTSAPITGKTIGEPKPESNPLSFLEGRIVFDAQERLRWENRANNYDFNNEFKSLTDDNWFEQRFRIGVKLKPTDWLTLYAQGQDSREAYSDRPDFPGALGAEGDDAFDLRQGWVEFGDLKQFPATLRLGRQVLSYGDERLVGAFDWNNIGRTFDAAKFHVEQQGWWLDAFAASVVVPERGSYNQSDLFNGNETQRDQVFSGLYFSSTIIPVQTTDVYGFYLHQNNSKTAAPPNNDTNFATVGIRIKSKPGIFAHHATVVVPDGKSTVDGKRVAPVLTGPVKPVGFEYEFEGAFQAGEVTGNMLRAFAVHGGLGYTFDCWGLPRVFAEYNYATGDEDPTDDHTQTFQNLFPTNHKFYGYMDVFSWQNMHNPALSLRLTPIKNVTFQVDGHAFWLATNEDVWYRANGATAVRPLNREADPWVGSEIDLTVTWKASKNLSFQAGYSQFFAGDYLKATGRNDDAKFGYIQTTIDF